MQQGQLQAAPFDLDTFAVTGRGFDVSEDRMIGPEDIFPRMSVSRSGHLVYATNGTLMAIPFDIDRLETIGDPSPVLSNLRTISGNRLALFDVSEDGLLVYLSADSNRERFKLVWVDHEGQEEDASLPGIYNYPMLYIAFFSYLFCIRCK